MNKFKSAIRITAILISGSILFLTACSNGSKKDNFSDTPTTGRVKIAVDATFQPLLEAELPVFHSLYKYATITPMYIDEVDAMNLLLKDSVRLAILSRGLKKEEMDYFHSKKFFPKEVKLALDGIAVILNPANTDTILSKDVLKQIFLGKITRWDQVNKKSGLGAIKVIFDHPNSSTVRFVVDSITGTGILGDQLSAMSYTNDVLDYVAKNKNAIGLIGVSWVSDRDDPKCLSFLKEVRVASISRETNATAENSYQPFQAYLATGQYPLTRFIYAVLSEPRPGLGAGITSFISSDKGQRIVQKLGILPYTQPVRIVNVKDE